MKTVTVVIPCDPTDCWRALTDATLVVVWLPGVRRVSIISHGLEGLPTEVDFELVGSLRYSLQYTYDVARREVRWEPRMGKRDAVRGFAKIEADGTQTRLTYGLEVAGARSGVQASLDDPAAIVAAFAAWIGGRTKS